MNTNSFTPCECLRISVIQDVGLRTDIGVDRRVGMEKEAAEKIFESLKFIGNAGTRIQAFRNPTDETIREAEERRGRFRNLR